MKLIETDEYIEIIPDEEEGEDFKENFKWGMVHASLLKFNDRKVWILRIKKNRK